MRVSKQKFFDGILYLIFGQIRPNFQMKYPIFTFIALFPLLTSSTYAQDVIENQNGKNSNQTIIRQAGDYSTKYNVLAVVVKRGLDDKETYDKFIDAVGKKLDENGVPFKFFQEYHDDKLGTVFAYLIENGLNGPFNVNEFAAILPHAIRHYKTEYHED